MATPRIGKVLEPHALTRAMLLTVGLLTACGGSDQGGGGGDSGGGSSGKSNISGNLYLPGSRGDTGTTRPPTVQAHQGKQGKSALTLEGKPVKVVVPDTLEPSGQVLAGRYLVRLSSHLSAQSLGALTVNGTTLKRTLSAPALGLALYTATKPLSAEESTGIMRQLAAQPGIAHVEADVVYRGLMTPNDPYFKYQWDARMMNLPTAWNRSTGKAVNVAVVDSGVIPHPEIKDKFLPGMDFVSDAGAAGDGDGVDSNPLDVDIDGSFHGSHVSGTIAASANNGRGTAGLNWGAKIVPVRVLGMGGEGSRADILFGTFWAAGGQLKYQDGTDFPLNPNPAKVINLSVGGKATCSADEQKLFDLLAGKGIVVVVAAGNDDEDALTYAPAGCNNVITVGAVGPDGARAPYSNYGSRIDLMAPGGNVSQTLTIDDVTIPGGILSTVYNPYDEAFDYAFYQGTSMAAPQVSAAAALLLGEEPRLTAAQVRDRLRASASPLPVACSAGCGAGILNVAGLLGGSGSTPAPAPQPVTTAPIYVAALYQLGQGFDLDRSVITKLTPARQTPPYALNGLKTGSYIVAAWQDLNKNGEIDDDEPFGMYRDNTRPEAVKIDSVARNIGGISFAMQTFGLIGQSGSSDQQGVLARQGLKRLLKER